MARPKDRGGTDCNDDFIKITELKERKTFRISEKLKNLKIKYLKMTKKAQGKMAANSKRCPIL